MKLLSPTPHKRLNEVAGFVFLSFGITALLSLVSYRAQDPSWNTASEARPLNLVGYPGAYFSDLLFQTFGIGAFLLPPIVFVLAWKWVRSEAVEAAWIKVGGNLMLVASLCGGVSLVGSSWTMFGGAVRVGGIAGVVVAGWLLRAFNLTGALILTSTCFVVSIYLVSTFSMATLARWFAGPVGDVKYWWDWYRARREEKRKLKLEQAKQRAAEKMAALREARENARRKKAEEPGAAKQTEPVVQPQPDAVAEEEPAADIEPVAEEIPICPFEERPPEPAPVTAGPVLVPERRSAHAAFRLPPTSLLNEPPGRSPYDEQELKDIAVRVKAKFEEFNVLGSVVQINPGPVVTTFEFKPEAGIKYSRITTLTEDLCLGLQAESILIERIPGKPTVGIEVPNSRREIIALRQVIESDEFQNSPSHLTISMGKDINGRIKVAALDTMPHLLIAGSTGSGKSVMINTMIMSILYKATPDEVRLIMIDPKRLELGLYEGIPHLLTPVITDPRKATNALRNAVLEMERRLRLLAEYGVRNIDQFNKKVRKLADQPRNLFEEEEDPPAEELKPLPQILIIIDELADLMMLEGRNVEESVTRLAQMARAVGMHLVLATQRPSVDVITGLIKANFPARISFRVATRVDSRTILDVMGAEHLLGRGDMLFLPPGSSRLIRVHASLVTETEINEVVSFWKQQATPEYDDTFLAAPPPDDGEEGEGGGGSDEQDPMYEEAVRIVLEMGKASTSTLQRRLRLGYGRAARILDMMYKDGIIGPPDGSKPREVLKRPDWLSEVVR
jgi:S-DNA-T family DNA segregation ATPase FtsK/SpoIIIE